MRFFLRPLSLTLVLSLSAASMASAGNSGNGGTRSTNVTVNDKFTDQLIRDVSRDFNECLQLFEAYRFDCYSKTYRDAARKLKGSTDYQPAYEAFQTLEARIAQAVAANIDPTQKKLRKGFRRYDPVKPAALPALKRETIRAMEEAKTTLLRSPAPHQKPHFQKIAAVIDSNKVLLRSALLKLKSQLRDFATLLSGTAAG